MGLAVTDQGGPKDTGPKEGLEVQGGPIREKNRRREENAGKARINT